MQTEYTLKEQIAKTMKHIHTRYYYSQPKSKDYTRLFAIEQDKFVTQMQEAFLNAMVH